MATVGPGLPHHLFAELFRSMTGIAVNYVPYLKTRHGLNIVATNNSWGGGGFDQSLLDAINYGASKGMLFVAAAGNNASSTPFYPAYYTNVIAVAAGILLYEVLRGR